MSLSKHILGFVACRFGLQAEPVLKAIEGLEGVEACEKYSYVRESRSYKYHLKKLRDTGKKVWAFIYQAQFRNILPDPNPGMVKQSTKQWVCARQQLICECFS